MSAVMVSSLVAAICGAAAPGIACATEDADRADIGGSSTPADFSMTWPDGWTVEVLDAGPPASGDVSDETAIPVLVRAGPDQGDESCEVIDLGALKAALGSFGIDDTGTLQQAAVGARHGQTRPGSYSTDGFYWSGFVEGQDEQGRPFALYSFLGRYSWTGLEDAWLALDCWAPTSSHADWEDIAGALSLSPGPDVRASTGPFVVGGRIELPAERVALELPEGWYGAAVADPTLLSRMETLGPPVEPMAEQLEASLGEYFAAVEETGSQVLIWAWEPIGRYSWNQTCELIRHPSKATDVRDLIEAGDRSLDGGPGSPFMDAWALVETPLGEAARHDYAEESGRTSSEYYFIVDEATYELECTLWPGGPQTGTDVLEHVYPGIAASLELPGVPRSVVDV